MTRPLPSDPAPADPPAADPLAVPGPPGPRTLTALAAERAVVICCGPGGVGKTTVSASVALQGARLGRRTCVVTVDPARRLADSLGLESLANVPTEVPGEWPGHLDAVMLDTKGTFDDLIRRYARSPEQAEAIAANRLYQNLSGALSGTQEYMAMEKLYELTGSGHYDLVVVDTPPSRNALDLLDAPRRLTHFLENRLFRALLLPTRAYLRAVSVATRTLLRTISTVAGAEIVHDAVAFFQAFQGMEEGFRTRAGTVRTLLADPATAYVVVTSGRPDAVAEATFFAERLRDRGVTPAALVVNRVQPRFDALSDDLPDAPEGSELRAMVDNLRELRAVAAGEEETYAGLVKMVDPAPVGRVPLLSSDVHDVQGVAEVADHLFGPAPTSPGEGDVG
ncbi:MAG TPA: ArsA-related P-loop ATPase [Acidimicrobiales bacterium]|nr:ArsA-related P-loop ATPase [Acidimicrobiales bacterium]